MTDQIAAAPVTAETSKPIIIAKSISSLTTDQAPAMAANGVTPITFNKEASQQNENNAEKPVSTEDKAEIKLSAAATLDEQAKLEQRVKKFGVQSENVKKNLRAARFGVETPAATTASPAAANTPESKEKLATRAQRFGIASPDNAQTKEQLDKRAARFGTVTAATATATSPAVTSEAAEKRKQRFGIVDDDSKKKLRNERFQATTTAAAQKI